MVGRAARPASPTGIREVRPDQAVWSFSSQQATLRRVHTAFAGFFRRVKARQKPGYPRFEGKAGFDTVKWPKDGGRAKPSAGGRAAKQG
jgi:putative transposase